MPIWVRLCWLSVMPLATAPRYQDRMPARSASPRLAWPARGRRWPGVGVDEQVGHGPGPDLAVGVEAVQPGQVAQPVGAAPGVQRVGEVLVSLVAVADDRAGVAGQDAAGVDGFLRPVAGVHRGEELGARDVDVVQFPGGAGGRLVGVEHPGGAQQHPDPVHERAQQPAALPRMPAMNPAETFTPVSAATSAAARATGR